VKCYNGNLSVRLRILNFNIIFSEFISGIHNLPTKHFWHHARHDNLVRVMLRNANSAPAPQTQKSGNGKKRRSHSPPALAPLRFLARLSTRSRRRPLGSPPLVAACRTPCGRQTTSSTVWSRSLQEASAAQRAK
jgi:hypothetical protein